MEQQYNSSMDGTNADRPNANKLRNVLRNLGYTEKKMYSEGELTSGGDGDISPGIGKACEHLFTTIKYIYPEIHIQVTAGKDLSHNGENSSSNHKRGQSVDFVIFNDKNDASIKTQNGWKTNPSWFPLYTTSDEIKIKKIELILLGYVAGNVVDDVKKFRLLNEYMYPSKDATGPHFHITWRDYGTSEKPYGDPAHDKALYMLNKGEITAYDVMKPQVNGNIIIKDNVQLQFIDNYFN